MKLQIVILLSLPILILGCFEEPKPRATLINQEFDPTAFPQYPEVKPQAFYGRILVDGLNPPPMMVEAFFDSRPAGAARTDGQGRFRIDLLPDRLLLYHLKVKSQGQELAEFPIKLLSPMPDGAGAFTYHQPAHLTCATRLMRFDNGEELKTTVEKYALNLLPLRPVALSTEKLDRLYRDCQARGIAGTSPLVNFYSGRQQSFTFNDELRMEVLADSFAGRDALQADLRLTWAGMAPLQVPNQTFLNGQDYLIYAEKEPVLITIKFGILPR